MPQIERAFIALTFSILLMSPMSAHAACSDMWDWLEKGCRRIVDTWNDGNHEIMFSGYSYHVPSTWTPEKRAELNSDAWGIGYGRSVEEPNGNTHTVSYLGFRDSHRNWQSNLGYAWSTFWGDRQNVQVGLGYTVFILQRPDIADGWPVPAALPLLTFRYQKANLIMTYIPTLGGGVNHGSTLYIFGSFTLPK